MPKRSKFSLSHYRLFSCDMGELVPCGLVEVLPGDTFQHATSILTRCSPLLAPVMHPVEVKVHHWFVPHRLVWEDFENFITGGPDGNDASVFPTITLASPGNADTGELADYLGIPAGIDGLEVSALPFRAYAKIYNEYYRDQDLITELTIDETSGPDTTTNTALQNVAWEKDYFTTARPWTQKGDEVTIPLTGDAPITGFGSADQTPTSGPATAYETDGSASTSYANYWTATELRLEQDPSNTGYPNIRADLSNVIAASVGDLRLAFALERYKEMRARYGSRYVEYLRSLGVRSSDARLQRPEYLGGGRQTIQFSEVLQTAPTTDGDATGVADLKGHGIGALRSNRYRRFFEEHGYVISLLSVKPKTMYADALPRHWNRRTKTDFWQRELQAIGQQEVLNKEVYAAHGTPDGVFGYQDRYDEYRRQESSVGGEFRGSSLYHWHMARIFGSAPTLNQDFVQSDPTKRVFQSTSTDGLWILANHSLQARRYVAGSARAFIF